ncbi:hypothetical protein LINPERHAP1_LOCUS14217 [Linum perenne]
MTNRRRLLVLSLETLMVRYLTDDLGSSYVLLPLSS